MQEQTGDTYKSSSYAKALMAAAAKDGKSSYLIAAALGQLPWQKHGGIVDDPKNLHVLTFDANALGGIKRFLLETCGARPEALGFRVYNLQEDLRQVSVAESDYNMDFFNAVMTTLQTIRERARGVPVVMFSSLTGMAQACERALAGPPGAKRGAGMDQSKWGAFAHQMNELRNFGQLDQWHCFWEGHIYKPAPTGQGGDTAAPKESLSISGKTGQNWAYNVEQVFRIRRQYGTKHPNTRCDLMYLDTQPAMDFIANGRGFTEALDPKEFDPVLAFHKLGLTIGRWGATASKPKVATKSAGAR